MTQSLRGRRGGSEKLGLTEEQKEVRFFSNNSPWCFSASYSPFVFVYAVVKTAIQ